MAGNFWQSSHCQQWILDHQDLKRDRQIDLKIITEEEYCKINIFFANLKNKFSYAFPQEFPYRTQHVLECEFYLLEAMYASDLGHDDSLLQMAWRIVNDSLRTDVSLLYPPYLIALACLHMACVILQKEAKQWFAELTVDMEKILEITKVILGLYEMWKTYDEKKEIASLLAKLPKPKTSSSRPPSQGPGGQDIVGQGNGQPGQPQSSQGQAQQV